MLKLLNWSTSMSDSIGLFQNQRTWDQIKHRVLDLVAQDHSVGLAQNSNLVRHLESQLAERFSRRYCVTTGSCSDALTVAMLALNLPAKSRVAVSNYTFTASAHAIARAGYQAVPVDVTDNYCIDSSLIADCQAVMAVDIFGNMSNWHSLNSLSIPVVCDAAQSFESHNGDSWSASNGVISCVSFSPSKTVSSWGSGGALLTDDADLAELARKLRLHGKSNNSDASIHPGMNSMISTFEAACVLAGLELSESWQRRRLHIAEYLMDNSVYSSSWDRNLSQHTLHKLVFQSDNRADVIARFKKARIDCVVHYSRLINDEPLYSTTSAMPVSDRLKTVSFTVPNQHTLTDQEVERIGELLK
jgi:UDP-2-acetamido-2-deoxy-ribo-hexuluronate aminotransferase